MQTCQPCISNNKQAATRPPSSRGLARLNSSAKTALCNSPITASCAHFLPPRRRAISSVVHRYPVYVSLALPTTPARQAWADPAPPQQGGAIQFLLEYPFLRGIKGEKLIISDNWMTCGKPQTRQDSLAQGVYSASQSCWEANKDRDSTLSLTPRFAEQKEYNPQDP